jgi:exodeoxyribonuclease V alpha subunit
MTCHKTQGSEYEKVLIAIEPQILKSSDSRKWLYTAVSRSKKDVSVCVVRNYFDKFIIK